MKATFLCALLVVAITAQAGAEPINGGIIDKLIVKALEFFRSVLKKGEPYSLPPLLNQKVINDRTKLIGNFYELKLSEASNFEIKKIQNNPLKLTANFELLLPQIVLQGKYNISGIAKGKKVLGNGKFELIVNTLDTEGSVNLGLTPKGLRMINANIAYTVVNGNVTAGGLNIQGLNEAQVENILAHHFLSYVQKNSKFIGSQVAENIKDVTNAFLSGKSVWNVVQWIKDVVEGKIIK